MKPKLSSLTKVVDRQRKELAKVRSLVQGFFGSKEKTELWIKTANPLLGGVKPTDMIRWGRGARLIQFIKTQLAENVPPIDKV